MSVIAIDWNLIIWTAAIFGLILFLLIRRIRRNK